MSYSQLYRNAVNRNIFYTNSSHLKAYNNFIVRNKARESGGAVLTYNNSSGTFDFNTIADNNLTYAIQLFGSSSLSVRSNIFSNVSTVIRNNGLRVNTEHNLFHNVEAVTTGSGTTTEEDNIAGSPNFNSFSRMDYHIRKNSDAQNRAIEIENINDDIDGDTRPQDDEPDIGADEYTPGRDESEPVNPALILYLLN